MNELQALRAIQEFMADVHLTGSDMPKFVNASNWLVGRLNELENPPTIEKKAPAGAK